MVDYYTAHPWMILFGIPIIFLHFQVELFIFFKWSISGFPNNLQTSKSLFVFGYQNYMLQWFQNALKISFLSLQWVLIFHKAKPLYRYP